MTMPSSRPPASTKASCPRFPSLVTMLAVAGLAVSVSEQQVFADREAPGQAIVAQGGVNPHRLYLRAGDVDTSLPPAAGLHTELGIHPSGTRYIIQLDGPITPERRQRLQAAGIGLGDYLPLHAYIITLPTPDRSQAIEALDFIRWYGLYRDEWKVDPDVGTRAYSTPERQELVAAGRDYLHVTIFPGADVAAVEQAIWDIPETVVLWSVNTGSASLGGVGVQLSIETSIAAAPARDDVAGADGERRPNIDAIAAIPGVQYIEPASDITTRAARRNDRARWIVQSNQTGVNPLYTQGLRGEGQIVGLLDTAVRQDHCSFLDAANPIGPNHRKIVAYNTSPGSSGHGTHTAGTVIGDAGQDTGNTRGVAYMGRLAYNSWGSSPFGDIAQRLMTHHDQGARTHSNSWGDDGTTAYNVLPRGVDLYQWENETGLTLWAVTNTNTLKNPENAKNTLAVGASRSAGLQHEHCTGGSGPTSDGRRKPEIYAPGCGTVSASTSACGTTSNTGTSMACPAVAGTAMLVRQYFMDGFYPVGIKVPGSDFEPSSALVKAVLLNSAVDMTGVTGYPSNQQGWGRVLADNAVYFDGDPRKLRISDVFNAAGLSTNQATEYFVPVLGSGEPFKVTLVWTDPPATAGASFAAINDLDLEVVDPTGQLYRGNVFDTTSGESIPGGSKDDRNNVEQVHIKQPAAGLWTVRVRAAGVNQGTQGYALVKTGDIVPAEPPELILILADPTPHLIEPDQPYELRVRILEGSQTLVPESGKLHYRDGSTGTFASVPLVHDSGDIYTANLPAHPCGDSPEYYFSAQGDLGATVVFPFEAPTNILSTNVGVILTEPLLETTFDTAWPAGWSATGVWHVTTSCVPAGNVCATGPYAYFGRSTTCNYNLPTGAHNGTLSSPPVELPAVPPDGGIVVKFCYALETEDHPNFDRAELLVNGQTRPEWRLPDIKPTTSEPDLYWVDAEIDLTEFAGETITLGWRFNTINSLNNNFRGWHVNNIRVQAQVAGCEEPEACYANCDGSSNEPILNVDDFTCFINKFAEAQGLPIEQQIEHYANCDGSSLPPVLNVDDFTCFINQFAQGCP